jgi:coatomer subunit beta'
VQTARFRAHIRPLQPLRLEVRKKLSSRSDRVKSVDIHPNEPWVLAALYNGHVFIWNYENQSLVKSFEVTELPVRCAKFIVRKQWFIASADDMHLRVSTGKSCCACE